MIGPRKPSSCVTQISIQLACRFAASAHMGSGRTSLYMTGGRSGISSACPAGAADGVVGVAPAAEAAALLLVAAVVRQ